MDRGLVTSKSLGWPVVGKTANARPVGWYVDDCHRGPAARVLSLQIHFGAKRDGRGQLPQRYGVCRPCSVVTCGSDGAVADSGNNRLLVWRLATRIAS